MAVAVTDIQPTIRMNEAEACGDAPLWEASFLSPDGKTIRLEVIYVPETQQLYRTLAIEEPERDGHIEVAKIGPGQWHDMEHHLAQLAAIDRAQLESGGGA